MLTKGIKINSKETCYKYLDPKKYRDLWNMFTDMISFLINMDFIFYVNIAISITEQ